MISYWSLTCALGLYYYLDSVANLSQDPEVYFRYIQFRPLLVLDGSSKLSESAERAITTTWRRSKTSSRAKLSDQLPLIIVCVRCDRCDRFNFVHDLVLYLYQNLPTSSRYMSKGSIQLVSHRSSVVYLTWFT